MNARIFSLTSLALIAMTTAALASGQSGSERAARTADDAKPVQIAQAREIEIYVDEYGREYIVDKWTGEVIGMRRRERGPSFEVERRRGRAEERRRAAEERRLSRREAKERQLEVELGLREPPSDYDHPGDYRRQRERHLRRGEPAGRFPEPPPVPERRNAGRAPLEPVQRAPLDGSAEPDQEPANAAPEEEGESLAALPGEQSPTVEESLPGEQAEPAPPSVGRSALEDVAKVQIVLDRMGLSPGVIDGRMGDNANKAISAYQDKTGRALRTYDKASIAQALEATGGSAFTEYEITPADAAGPYVASVPEDYGEKARLDRLGYTSVAEALAERFHMDEGYLKALNPGADFSRPGTVITVARSGPAISGEVTRIIADKGRKQVRAYDAAGKLVVAYPATIGSPDTPSPSGTVTVERIAHDPEYTYNPKLNFRQGGNDRTLTIPPGPNGPVGSIWIALSKPTYGIHGTAEPSKIGKTFSHGCVRLTNWDATELAGLVKQGTVVEFVE